MEIWYYHFESTDTWAAVLRLGAVTKELLGFASVTEAQTAAVAEAKRYAARGRLQLVN